MGFFLETLFGGLMVGMLYSLVALGFVLIFKASGVFNFAQGAMVLFAALAMARFSEWIPAWTGISSVIPSWLTSLPRTKRSITHASAIITRIATANASTLTSHFDSRPVQPGIHCEKRAIASAANKTIAPCAKLKTPEALKISTKPSAISE